MRLPLDPESIELREILDGYCNVGIHTIAFHSAALDNIDKHVFLAMEVEQTAHDQQ